MKIKLYCLKINENEIKTTIIIAEKIPIVAKSFIDNTPRKIDIFDGNINRSKPYIKIYPN